MMYPTTKQNMFPIKSIIRYYVHLEGS